MRLRFTHGASALRGAGAVIFFITSCLHLPALAAGSVPLSIAPTSVKLDLATEYASLEVANRGEEPTGIEVEMLHIRWVDGKEQYEPTQNFVVSPPSFRLQPDKSRLVRFRYEGPRDDTEGYYRMFVRQLPGSEGAAQINMVFNIGVPVFVAPTSSRPALQIAGSELRNTGNVSLTVSQLEGNGCPDGTQKVQARVAPQQKVALKADLSRCATGAQTDRGLIPLAAP